MHYPTLANRLSDLLDLRHPPVALTSLQEPPAGIQSLTTPVPSACTFWRQAETSTFFATAAQHFNCPVGSMVMGFDLPADVNEQLGGLVQSMCDAQYLEIAEAAAIPKIEHASNGVLYGPLNQATIEPDLVLLWVDLAQAMLYNEAAGRADWTATPLDVTGRPGCTALPRALASGSPALSFGCIGMRTFTGIENDLGLAAIPGRALADFVESLETTVEANASMRSFYEAHALAVGSDAAARPW